MSARPVPPKTDLCLSVLRWGKKAGGGGGVVGGGGEEGVFEGDPKGNRPAPLLFLAPRKGHGIPSLLKKKKTLKYRKNLSIQVNRPPRQSALKRKKKKNESSSASRKGGKLEAQLKQLLNR